MSYSRQLSSGFIVFLRGQGIIVEDQLSYFINIRGRDVSILIIYEKFKRHYRLNPKKEKNMRLSEKFTVLIKYLHG